MPLLPTHKTLPDTATQGHPASAISVTPVGNVIATDVQTAIQELDSQITPPPPALNLNLATSYGGF